MAQVSFEIYNVFAETEWGGNPLAIIPNADNISDEQMQFIARQFNLSETVFICRSISDSCIAKLRIFTPESEMVFAGHPTIGAAAWLHQNLMLSDTFMVQTQAKTVQIEHHKGVYRFTVIGYSSQQCALNSTDLAAGLSLSVTDLKEDALWVNTGSWQLIVPLSNKDALVRARPNFKILADLNVPANRPNIYLWHETNSEVSSRYFFDAGGYVLEDPATGSACANLGAWAHLHNLAPLSWRITQAEQMNRLSYLHLSVDAAGAIQVGGEDYSNCKG
jgi:trans-2,3-dihydro-3-hydroxyanthranilate isomerase